MKANWFSTLSEALESENLSSLWPIDSSIKYGETVRHTVSGIAISIYRETDGRYERPIHYAVSGNKKSDTVIKELRMYGCTGIEIDEELQILENDKDALMAAMSVLSDAQEELFFDTEKSRQSINRAKRIIDHVRRKMTL